LIIKTQNDRSHAFPRWKSEIGKPAASGKKPHRQSDFCPGKPVKNHAGYPEICGAKAHLTIHIPLRFSPSEPAKDHTGDRKSETFFCNYTHKIKNHILNISKIRVQNTKSRRTGFLPRRRE